MSRRGFKLRLTRVPPRHRDDTALILDHTHPPFKPVKQTRGNATVSELSTLI